MYELFIETNSEMTVASFDYKYDIPYAVLENNNNVVSALKEKPTMLYSTNAGIYFSSLSLVLTPQGGPLARHRRKNGVRWHSLGTMRHQCRKKKNQTKAVPAASWAPPLFL